MKATPGTKIIATKDKMWPRRESMKFDSTEFEAADWNQCQRLIDIINQHFDAVIVHSVPSKKHPQACIDNFVRMVQSITIPKAGIQVDHSIHSISRNARFDEICEDLDILMTHSLTNDFSRWARKSEKQFGSGRTVEITTPLTTMGLGFDFDGHRAKYWVPIEEQDDYEVRWIGRTAAWKGPGLMIDFHNEALRDLGYRTIMEGLEASINYPQVLYKDGFDMKQPREANNWFRPRKELGEGGEPLVYGSEKHGEAPYLYIPYDNEECMNRMKYSAYGSDLYHLKAKMYGNNIENCHAECIASGTVPIFHKHFCDNVIHRAQGDPISKCKNTGTIALDENNFEQCSKAMKILSDDPVRRDEWREMSFEFWKQHADASIVAGEIVDIIKNRKSYPKHTYETK
jgi:hypothetical protein